MQRLRELRKAKGLSMKELGKMFGLAESTISLYESGKRQPDTEIIKRFANFFGVSVDYLLGVSQEEEPEYTEDEKELFDLIMQLTDEEAQEMWHFLEYLISKRQKK